MGQPAARATDMHVCPMVTVLVPHVGGPILPPGCPTVLIQGLPAARATDMATCVGPPDVLLPGGSTTLIGSMPAARLGDLTAHGGFDRAGLFHGACGLGEIARMPYQASFGNIPVVGEPLQAPQPESPLRIGVLGDFSGRQSRGKAGSTQEIAGRRLVRINRDNFDEVMAKLGVQLEVPVGDEAAKVSLSFASMDDFEPDQLHDRVDPIADLYDSDEKSAAMNSLLHHPDFQALESAWRGLYWLLGRVAKGTQVEVTLVDISLAELAADLKSSDNLGATGLFQLLIEKRVRGPRGEPWGVLVGNYAFDLTGQHAELLGRLAKIASQTNAPLLTSVNPQVLDKSFVMNPDAGPAWYALRQLPEAALLGLAVPRFLLRLPYGENTKSIDKFSYEEMPKPPEAKGYLWGHPALLGAALLAQAFLKDGWALTPGSVLELDNLPIHVYRVDDEEEVTLAEAWLVRPQTEQLIKNGIMPFLCVRGKGAIQVSSFLSLALPAKDQPPRELHGHWSGGLIAPPAARAAAPAAKMGAVGDLPAARRPTPPPEIIPPPPPGTPAPARAAAPPASPPVARPAPAAAPAAAKPPAAAPAAKPPPPAAPKAPAAPAPAAPPAAAPAAKAAPPAEPAAAEEEEMDPDLAALLKELE